MYLEGVVGGEHAFAPFFLHYIAKHQYGTVDPETFLSDLREYFASNAEATAGLNAVDWATWLTLPGMPPVVNVFDTSLVDQADQAVDMWKKGRCVGCVGETGRAREYGSRDI